MHFEITKKFVLSTVLLVLLAHTGVLFLIYRFSVNDKSHVEKPVFILEMVNLETIDTKEHSGNYGAISMQNNSIEKPQKTISNTGLSTPYDHPPATPAKTSKEKDLAKQPVITQQKEDILDKNSREQKTTPVEAADSSAYLTGAVHGEMASRQTNSGSSPRNAGSNSGSGSGSGEEGKSAQTQLAKHIFISRSYPDVLKNQHIEGTVLLQVVVSATGRPSNIKIIRSTHPALSAIAEKAAKTGRYHPAIRDGKAIQSTIEFSITYKVTDET